MTVAAPLAYLRLVHRRRGPGRRWLAETAPALVAAVAPVAPDASGAQGRWQTDSVSVTDTLVGVAVVGCRATGRRAVVKLPYTAEGAASLARQAEALTALHADRRLDGWRAVVPRHLGRGEAGGRPYWVEEAVPGRAPAAALLRGAGSGALLDAATRLVEGLHARTGEQRRLDPATVEAWVERPLRRIEAWIERPPQRIEAFSATRPHRARLLEATGRARAELTAALAGRTVRTCWIHGDFWPGNLLVSGPAPTGVVDWDQAGAGHLPLHDLLHLYVMARRMTGGDELGDVVVAATRRGVAEAIGVHPDRVASWLDGIPPRPAVLLYWLRHISLFIDSEGHRDNPRWLRGNVERVLARI